MAKLSVALAFLQTLGDWVYADGLIPPQAPGSRYA